MRIVYWLAIYCCVIHISLSVISIQQLSTLTLADLNNDELVEVTETTDHSSLNNFQREYYVIKVTHKEKSQAYAHMKWLFKRTIHILISNKVIPDEERLVKSKIKPQYLNKKRKWSFSTIFVICGSPAELQKCYSGLQKLGIQRLDTEPTINFLNEKIITLEVFNSGKKKLVKELERFPGYQIKDVKEIQIKGVNVENSDLLEEVLAEEFEDSQEIIEEEEIMKDINKTARGPIQMKILFQIGMIDEGASEDNDSDDDNWNDEPSDEDYSDNTEETL